MDLYLLYETASGYALFHRGEFDEMAQADDNMQEAIADAGQFKRQVTYRAFMPFTSAEEALEEMTAVANGEASEGLCNFLSMHLPKKSSKYKLGVYDPSLGQQLSEKGVPATCSQSVRELFRGIRVHLGKVLKEVETDDLEKARLGLGHAYSRNKMQFDPNKQDKPIMNTIALLDGLDKNINTFAMRVKEWYSWHFPEMAKIVTDNIVYAKVAQIIRLRNEFNWDDEEAMARVVETCGDDEVAAEIAKAAKSSMGQDIVELDMQNIEHFASQVVSLSEMRAHLSDYLKNKMNVVAPNLLSLIGETVGARLISHAGSLTNLAKYPASTVQILGAEKALFRALKTKGNTPKYGLIFHSSFIGKANQKNKGRISRYLANKCSMASRIDCFGETPSNIFGDKMREQVEERLAYLSTGVKPRRNVEVMREADQEVEALRAAEVKAKKKAKKEKKRKAAEEAEESQEPAEEAPKKKKKRSAEALEEAEEPVEEPKKKKKKSKAE